MTAMLRLKVFGLFALILLGVALIVFLDSSEGENSEDSFHYLKIDNLRADKTQESHKKKPIQKKPNNKKSDSECATVCQTVSEVATRWEPEKLLEAAQNAREDMIERIRPGYGKYFDKIFLQPNNTVQSFTPETPHYDDLRRKLQIKIIKTQLLQRESDMSQLSTDECDCDESSPPTRFLEGSNNSTNAEASGEYPRKIAHGCFTKYIWATGGHSAAAGHGNLYNESYTAHLERDVKPIFASLGIDFEGRNYAMGNSPSGPEVAMCFPQIFGHDVDFFVWDFAMTDIDDWGQMAHYLYRGALSPNFPPAIGLHMDGNVGRGQQRTFAAVENLGLPLFELTHEGFQERKAATPDTMELSQVEIDEMPEYLRLLRCGEKWENGDVCGMEKYSKWGCEERQGQVTWHPGFKAHAMDGHALAIFLADRLLDAVSDLVAQNTTRPESLLKDLEQEEQEARDRFLQSKLPEGIPQEKIALYDPSEDEVRLPLNESILWRSPSMCRTGRLPAESRYLGYMSSTNEVGGITTLGEEMYDVGTPTTEAQDVNVSMGEMLLSYEPGDIERRVCGAIMRPDYKNFFYTHEDNGWNTLIMPNEKEKEAYNYDPEKVHGYIFMQLVVCHGHCFEENLREQNLEDGDWELMINGQKVTRVGPRGLLIGDHGIQWQPNESGEYEFRARVHQGYVKISGFVIY